AASRRGARRDRRARAAARDAAPRAAPGAAAVAGEGGGGAALVGGARDAGALPLGGEAGPRRAVARRVRDRLIPRPDYTSSGAPSPSGEAGARGNTITGSSGRGR